MSVSLGNIKLYFSTFFVLCMLKFVAGIFEHSGDLVCYATCIVIDYLI